MRLDVLCNEYFVVLVVYDDGSQQLIRGHSEQRWFVSSKTNDLQLEVCVTVFSCNEKHV